MDTLEISHTVTIRIGKGIDKDLISSAGSLFTVKGGGLGHDGLGLLLAGHLAHENLLGGAAAGNGNLAGAGLGFVIGHRHAKGAAGGGNLDPVGLGRSAPGTGRRHSHRLGRCSLGGKGQARRVQGQGIGRIVFPLFPTGNEEGAERSQKDVF